jgi:hypothetical protein
VIACLAGGAQLHSRANIEAVGAGMTGRQAGRPAGTAGVRRPGSVAKAGPLGAGLDDEIQAAVRYEKGLAIKALLAIALVGLVLAFRVCFLG